LQLGIIISVSCAVGWAFTRCGQPAVVGEMLAGILLGPSLFGLLAPKAFLFVFAPASLDALRLFSQIGVCIFMFAVGMELDLSQFRHSAHRFLVIGHSSILIPYLFGVVLALSLYSNYAEAGASFTAFALIMGISMSITAFPVLVRILQDRKLFRSKLGQTATLCAAIGDVTAWCILAFVVAIAGAVNVKAAVFSLGLVGVYGAAMILIIKPLLRRLLGGSLLEESEPTKGVLALVLGTVLVSALSTEIIGIHALFGAFLAGIVMPAGGGFRKKLVVRVEHFSSVLLLPLFFAFIGLRTQIGLLNGARDWLICLGIIVVATVGKLGGTALVSRMMKMTWHESLKLGALMNTRGLMELIVLNIGYDLGILSLRIFTMLVLMAICTTLMTGPLLSLFRDKAAVRAG
jgi:Kef-type K+ transport system membrane component KefB